MKDLFDNRKQTLIRTKRAKLIADVESLLDQVVMTMTNWAGHPHRRSDSMLNFQKCITSLSNSRDVDADEGEVEQQERECLITLSQRFPVLPDFEIDDTTVFADCFARTVAAWRDQRNVELWLDELIEMSCSKQESQMWDQVKGCGATCPLCGFEKTKGLF